MNDVLDALEAGAAGYALKSDGPETLIEAIRVVSRGQRYMAAALAPRLAAFEGRRRRASDVLGILSAREREVFRLASECVIARDMARELCIARKTVDTHLNRINRKLGLRNMAELVRLAASLGMLHSARTPRPKSADAADRADLNAPGRAEAAASRASRSASAVAGRGGEDVLRAERRERAGSPELAQHVIARGRPASVGPRSARSALRVAGDHADERAPQVLSAAQQQQDDGLGCQRRPLGAAHLPARGRRRRTGCRREAAR